MVNLVEIWCIWWRWFSIIESLDKVIDCILACRPHMLWIVIFREDLTSLKAWTCIFRQMDFDPYREVVECMLARPPLEERAFHHYISILEKICPAIWRYSVSRVSWVIHFGTNLSSYNLPLVGANLIEVWYVHFMSRERGYNLFWIV